MDNWPLTQSYSFTNQQSKIIVRKADSNSTLSTEVWPLLSTLPHTKRHPATLLDTTVSWGQWQYEKCAWEAVSRRRKLTFRHPLQVTVPAWLGQQQCKKLLSSPVSSGARQYQLFFRRWQKGRKKPHPTWSPKEQGYLQSLTFLVLGPFPKRDRLQGNTFIKMDVFNKSKPWSKISSSPCHSFVCQVPLGEIRIPDYNAVWLNKAHNEK